ncbi:MAG: serine/threonine-protein kinase [Calothrix sp. MO_167.B12]|nr:serine/threonine-protein kinase [Calothrix sp. MO_167.B12]
MSMVMTGIAGKSKEYIFIDLLGKGAFGETYLAEDIYNNQYAVKKFTFSSPKSSEVNKAKELFQREVQTLQKLNKHPNIPDFCEYIDNNQELYLVQEYINGRTLGDKLEEVKTFSVEDAIQVLKDLLNIIHDLHERDIIHRDIKPDNIMMDNTGKLFLIDFGAVKKIISHVTKIQSPGTKIFTDGYAPWEQKYGYPQKNSDIYAVGITIIQLITGLLPGEISDDWEQKVKIPDDLQYIIPILNKMIHNQHETGYRYQSVKEIRKDLRNTSLQKTQVIVTGSKTNNPNLSNQAFSMEFVLLGVFIFLILVVMFDTVFLPGRKNTPKPQSQLIHKLVDKSLDNNNLCLLA